jgi:sulfide:quinone oxidoreductase
MRKVAQPVNKIIRLTPHFAVTGALQPEDFAEVANQGFKSILSNLPDGESARHPSSAEERELAAKAGLGFRHVPAVKADVLSDRVVEGVITALSELEGPVLAHCASGLRSAVAWAAAASRTEPVEAVLATLERAGFNLAALRDELEEQHGRASSEPAPLALRVARETR